MSICKVRILHIHVRSKKTLLGYTQYITLWRRSNEGLNSICRDNAPTPGDEHNILTSTLSFEKKILNYVCLLHSSFGLCCVCQLIYFCKNKYLCHYHCFCYPLYFSWLLFNILPLFSSDVIYSVSKFHSFVHGRRTSMKKKYLRWRC